LDHAEFKRLGGFEWRQDIRETRREHRVTWPRRANRQEITTTRTPLRRNEWEVIPTDVSDPQSISSCRSIRRMRGLLIFSVKFIQSLHGLLKQMEI
jgi:hypothetical protein